MILVCLCPLFLSGCGETKFSATDIDALYTTMKQDDDTSQFFGANNNLVVNFSSKINTANSSDKSYIFSQVYKFYLDSSSRLFSTVVERNTTPSFVIRNFKEREITTIYNNLNDVYSKMKALSDSKTVYEQSEGYIYYRKLLTDYNNLISSLLTLNTNFANAYFATAGKVDYSKTDFGDSDIRNMLCYQLMLASKVSFDYELRSFKISNPMGEVLTWYNASNQIKSFVPLATACLAIINSPVENIVSKTNMNTISSLYTTIQENADKYNNEYLKFNKALENFNAKEFLVLSQAERTVYLENCTALENSSYNIIQNFISGRYSALVNCLDEITSAINI